MRKAGLLIFIFISVFYQKSVSAHLRCRADCVDDFKYLMELTGWSKNTVMIAFFAIIFVVLVSSALIYARFRAKRRK